MKKHQNLFQNDYPFCGKTHFLVIKGISIFLIVLVHLCNRYLDFGLLSPFAGAAVAVFLLCSGYGLSESFLNKGGLNGFWENKLVKIWLPSFLKLGCVALIAGSGWLLWLTEYPLFLYGWYLQVLFGEYLVFWILFRFVKHEKARLIGLFAASALAFLLIRSQLYAEQLLSFPLGVLFSQLKWKEKMETWNWKKKGVLILMCCVVAAGAFLFRKKFQHDILLNLVWMLFKLSIAILICIVPYYLRRIRILGIFIPFGVYSYMLYLINNNVLALLEHGTRWYQVAGVLVFLLVAAVIFQYVSDGLAKLYHQVKKKSLAKAAQP